MSTPSVLRSGDVQDGSRDDGEVTESLPLLCPCGTKNPYDQCCGRFHRGELPSTAEQLMRSRFTAFALGLADYLLTTWHPSSRPDGVEFDPNLTWRKLQIVDTVAGRGSDREGIVEFRAAFRSADGSGVMHERSNFVYESDRWFYIDGVMLD